MKVGDKVTVWGAVMEDTNDGYTIAMQYGKNICEVLEINKYGAVKLRYDDPDEDGSQPEHWWIGWVHKKQIEAL